MRTSGTWTKWAWLLGVGLGVALVLWAAGKGCKEDDPDPRTQDIWRHAKIKLRYLGNTSREIPGDPEAYNIPRLQFTWDSDEDGRLSIWSIRIDGTDLRLVVDYKFFLARGIDSMHRPKRSPDGRYIVFTNRLQRMLLDLKTMQVEEMDEGGSPPFYQFTDDSQSVLFYTYPRLKRYHIPSGKLERFPRNYSERFHVVRGQNQILAVKPKGVEFYDFKAKLLRKVDIIGTGRYGDPKKREISSVNSASLDGRLLYFEPRFPNKSYIVNLEKPDRPIHEEERHIYNATFGPDGDSVYYIRDYNIMRLDLPTKDRMVFIGSDRAFIFRHRGGGQYHDLCLYNF